MFLLHGKVIAITHFIKDTKTTIGLDLNKNKLPKKCLKNLSPKLIRTEDEKIV